MYSCGNDCAPADPTKWKLKAYCKDADNDSYTGVEQTNLCVGNTDPAGYVPGFTCGTDCNDGDSCQYQNWTQLYLDSDGDGFGTGAPITVCGDNIIPTGYASQGGDCDDSNVSIWQKRYVCTDGDGDGVGWQRL